MTCKTLTAKMTEIKKSLSRVKASRANALIRGDLSLARDLANKAAYLEGELTGYTSERYERFGR